MKAVKGVGRSVGKVIKGAAKVVKSVTKSKIFKTIAMAAAVYFTGGAIAGAMGGMSATAAGGLAGAGSGAMAGIQSAWAGLANGTLLGGAATEGIGAAVSGVGSGTISGGLSAAGQAFTNVGGTLASMGGTLPGVGSVLGPPKIGLIAKMMSSPYAAPALINVGGSLIAGNMADRAEAKDRSRYNTNVGTRLWGAPEQASAPVRRSAADPNPATYFEPRA